MMLLGMELTIDPTAPPDTIEFRDPKTGQKLGFIRVE